MGWRDISRKFCYLARMKRITSVFAVSLILVAKRVITENVKK
nr:MAG TPA: hypothetical protein [Caudoviricetes sp.]